MSEEQQGRQPIEINRHRVAVELGAATGRAIKDAAIKHGLPIDAGFVLFRLEGTAQHQVRDDDRVDVHKHKHFRCVAPDDNS